MTAHLLFELVSRFPVRSHRAEPFFVLCEISRVPSSHISHLVLRLFGSGFSLARRVSPQKL